MSITAKVVIYVTCALFLICGAQAQTGQGILCDTEVQVRALAEAGGDTDALHMINARTPNACVFAIVRYVEPTPVGTTTMGNQVAGIVQLTVTGFFVRGHWMELAPSTQYMLVPLGQGASLPHPTLVHDVPGIAAKDQWWYQNAETNPEARHTFPQPWMKCCNHAEVVPMQNIVFPTDAHGWQWNDSGTIRDIPDVVVHWSEAAPDNKPTLFVYLGVMTCFYPPQGGV